MALWIWIIIGFLLIWVAIAGRPGSMLGAIIDPSSLAEHATTEGGEF